MVAVRLVPLPGADRDALEIFARRAPLCLGHRGGLRFRFAHVLGHEFVVAYPSPLTYAVSRYRA